MLIYSHRLFLQDIKLTQRRRILTIDEKQIVINKYKEEKRREKIKKAIELGLDIDPLTLTDSGAGTEADETNDIILQDLINKETMKEIVLPKLLLFLTVKKPRIRMTDIHKTGYLVPLGMIYMYMYMFYYICIFVVYIRSRYIPVFVGSIVLYMHVPM